MWYSETEVLAARLANKDQCDIQEILDDHDVIRLQSQERNKLNIFNRLFLAFSFPFLIILFCIKWLLTGDGHLDSWAKKFKPLSLIFKFSGIQ